MLPQRWLGLLLLVAAPAFSATLTVCYHYGCARQATLTLDATELARLGQRFAHVDSPASERAAIADTVSALYRLAARISPIASDKGRNPPDDDSEGKMDCVDHSRNVSGFLALMDAEGWLRHHRAAGVVHRAPWFVDGHFAARLDARDGGQSWVVDTWFADFGAPPAVVPLAIWMRGYSP
ncbi:hypothetical protein EV683_13210 [Crenobacter luteus]|uniref:hypothetical protein n=1 Tax=Crenobacter luteus TaxID=1452487 RepID=UPI00104D76FB|nr:hypothetical protein [Crenobacter luteus]TCP08489.1 hypothetical protein EV683_13210 [Crenobacter luteus]